MEGDLLASTNAVISDAGGDEEDAAWVRANGGKNAESMIAFVRGRRSAEAAEKRDLALAARSPSSFRGEFWNECHNAPCYQYPPGWKMNDVLEQHWLLAPRFRGLDVSHIEPLMRRYLKVGAVAPPDLGEENRVLQLPNGMDGLLTFPKLDKIASYVKGKKGWTDISKAIGYLLEVLSEVVPDFKHRINHYIGPGYYKLSDTVAHALAKDAESTPGDYHVLPVQSGRLYAGYSVRAARGHIAARPREYGMPCFMALCLILGNPGRIAKEALVLECAGTEIDPTGKADDFRAAPSFSRDSQGIMQNGVRWVGYACFSTGSASFVLPE